MMLLDEPTTFLDLTHQIDVLDLLADLNHQRDRRASGLAALFTTMSTPPNRSTVASTDAPELIGISHMGRNRQGGPALGHDGGRGLFAGILGPRWADVGDLVAHPSGPQAERISASRSRALTPSSAMHAS